MQEPQPLPLDKISNMGWIALLVMGLALIIVVLIIALTLFDFFKNKNLKTRLFEITNLEKEHKETQRDLLMTEGKDQLENQCQVAHELLKEIRSRLYMTAVTMFGISDKKDLVICELITYRIADKLNYDVKNDLTRNHISKKNNYELDEYSRAKALGYYSMIKDRLFVFNDKLPEYDLPKIMERISISDFETLFRDIYYSARRIAGGGVKENG